VRVGRKRVERLMRATGLAVPARRRPVPRTTDRCSVDELYNRRRRHSGLGFSTPAQAYEQMARAA